MGPRSRKAIKSNRGADCAGSGTPPASGQPLLPSRSRQRRAFRLIAALLVPLVMLGALEVSLRLVGFGYPTSFFLRAEIEGRASFVENRKFGWRFFPSAAARTPRSLALLAEKPNDTLRVFVFGESAAYGDPDADFGFPRVLEVLLRDQFPGKHVEVINVAMTAINSHVILPIARDCASRAGDIWVIYTGNNEVIGPFGAGSASGSQAPPLAFARANIAFKATKIGQALEAVTDGFGRSARRTSKWIGMETFVANRLLPDDPRMARIYDHFERNLSDIVEAGTSSGASVIVCTVASNLKDCPPFASLHTPKLTNSQIKEWQGLYDAAARAETNNALSEAVELYGRAAQIDSNFADLQFRWGRCELALGHLPEAEKHLVLARDADALRFRADSHINQIIRQLAERIKPETRASVLDIEKALAGSSKGIPGHELFHEHVHFNFDGNYAVARLLADKVATTLSETPASRSQPPTAADCARRLGLSDWSELGVCNVLLQRMNEAPFTYQLDHDVAYTRLEQRRNQLRANLTPAALQNALTLNQQALTNAPGDWTLHKNVSRLLKEVGDSTAAAREAREVIRLVPQCFDGWMLLGASLAQTGEAGEAVNAFSEAIGLEPRSEEARLGLGMAELRQGHFRRAVALLEQVLQAKPDYAEAHAALGQAFIGESNSDKALPHLQRALELDPHNSLAARLLAENFNRAGELSEAVAAVTNSPSDFGLRLKLGNQLVALGRFDEARAQFAEAVRLKPDSTDARDLLGFELARVGQFAEALPHFAERVKLEPNNAEAHMNLGVAFVRVHRLEEAAKEFELALQINPVDDRVKKYLEKVRVLRGQ